MKKSFIPFAVFAAVVVLAALPMLKGKDPTAFDSALLGLSAPEFSLPPAYEGSSGFSRADIGKGEVIALNFFASWCVTCAPEQPVLEALSKKIPVYGINYKDKPDIAKKWLDRHGNPYKAVGADADGRVAIEFGVTGVPETFIIGADGIVLKRIAGPLSHDMAEELVKEAAR